MTGSNQSPLIYPISPLCFSDEALSVTFLRNELDKFQTWSFDLFKQSISKKQNNIEELLRQRSHFIDQLLTRLWHYFQIPTKVRSCFTANRISLIAVGGYGRATLHPLSDIDILILSDKPLPKTVEKQVGDLIRLLWDLHLDIGQSVRTLKECLQDAKNDITIMTNLIESRLIIGSPELFNKLRSAIFDNKIWPSSNFYRAKIDEQNLRHKQYHSTSYNLEPDLKNSPGGLRDIQTIQWIAVRHFGVSSLSEIKNYLTVEEIAELQTCERFLWRMRFALHAVITRYDNRLLFDRQLSIAKLLGYQGERNAPVEKMMRDYYRVAHSITELNQMLIQLFEESILSLNAKNSPYSLDEQFQVRENLIDIKQRDLFQRNSVMIMQLFYTLLQHPTIMGIHSNTIRQLRIARRQLPDLLSVNKEARELFMAIIKHPNAIKKAILPMHKHGILAAYIPGWKHIVGMMQFDLFHIYTVDEHTIRLLLELDDLRSDEGKKRHPNSSTVYAKLTKPELLIITGLFHDIAKGQNGDHSQLGADLVIPFCKDHGIDEHDSKLISWLVRCHLLMSVTAQSRDLQDPAVIKEFALQIKNRRRLQYLLCLTVADVCATNETLWNSWKQSLLRELYTLTERSFDLGIHEIPEQRSIAREHKRSALVILLQKGFSEDEVRQFWQNYRLDYFLRYTTDQIVWHAENLLHHDLDNILVLINPKPFHGGTEIVIYSPDKRYLFADVCNQLNNRNLTIHDAMIITNKRGFALDTFIVLDSNGQTVSADRHETIKQALEKTLQKPVYKKVVIKPLKARLRPFAKPTQINFLSTLSDQQTYMELIAIDRQGLLATIGEIFAKLDISLRSAKIATIGEHVEDLFILVDNSNRALDDNLCQIVREAIIIAIDNMDNTTIPISR